MKIKRIAIICAGTGGHIYPSMALISLLEGYGLIPIIVTTKNYKEKHFSSDEFKDKTIHDILPEKKNIFSMLKSFYKSMMFFIYNDIDSAISFGSYHAFPACVIVRIMRIPLFMYESNVLMGRSNEIIFRFFGGIVMSSMGMIKGYENHPRILYLGHLLRKEFINAKKNIVSENQEKLKFTILITNGTLGSNFFDTKIHNALISLPKSIKSQLSVIQQVRNSKEIQVRKNLYNKHNIECIISTFFENMYEHVISSDLIITRAGGSISSEILFFNKPAIFIPMPNSKIDHQRYNALYLNDNGMGIYIDEQRYELLPNYIDELINNKSILNEISKRIERKFKIFDIDALYKMLQK